MKGAPRHAARRDRGGLRRDARARRHLPDRRRDRALREPARDDGRGRRGSPRRARGSPSSCGTKLATSTLLSHRVIGAARRPAATGPASPRYMRDWLELQREVSRLPAARPPAGRDLPARRPAPPLPLRLRRPQRPPDARPAGDAADGDCGPPPARLRRQRLRAADLGPRPGDRPGRAARRRTACATASRAGSARTR